MAAADSEYREKLLDAQSKFIEWENKSAMEQLQEIVVTEREEKSLGEKFKAARAEGYAQFFEDIAPVKNLVDEIEKESGKKILDAKNPYIAFRNYKGMAGRAKMLIEGNSTTKTGRAERKFLRDAAYRKKVRRNNFRIRRKIRRGAKRFSEIFKYVVCIITDGGLKSEDTYKGLLKKWKHYVPLHRLFDENENLAYGDSLKHMQGSVRDIIDTIQAIMESTNIEGGEKKYLQTNAAVVRAVYFRRKAGFFICAGILILFFLALKDFRKSIKENPFGDYEQPRFFATLGVLGTFF